MTQDHTKGQMDVREQSHLFTQFMTVGAWCAIILLLVIGYTTFTLSLGMSWIVALAICAVTGIAVGLGLGFGSAWVATIVGLSVLAVITQMVIGLFSFFI